MIGVFLIIIAVIVVVWCMYFVMAIAITLYRINLSLKLMTTAQKLSSDRLASICENISQQRRV